MKSYQAKCQSCGRLTTCKYANTHEGKCKRCVSGIDQRPSRQDRINEYGYQAYAREEGHYDIPDNA